MQYFKLKLMKKIHVEHNIKILNNARICQYSCLGVKDFRNVDNLVLLKLGLALQ